MPNRLRKAPHDRDAACLTIVEADALGSLRLNPGVLDRLRADHHATMVQQSDEAPWTFAIRVARRVAHMVESGSCLRLAVVVTNGDDDPQTLAARWWITRALLPAIQLAGDGRLVLRAPDGLPAGNRHALLALAGNMTSDLRAVNEVSVVFGSDSPPSVSTQFVQPDLAAVEQAGAA
jgi:hypothetical protein